jgi:hypothetical protein
LLGEEEGMAEGAEVAHETTGAEPADVRRCRVHDAKAGHVQLLDAYSHAVETVVDAVAPAVASIVIRLKSRTRPPADPRSPLAAQRMVTPECYTPR